MLGAVHARLAALLALCAVGAGAHRMLCLLPYPGKSHYMVFEPLLEELEARGHNLTVVSFFPKDVSRPTRRDVSLVGLAPVSLEVIDLGSFENSFFGLERYMEHAPLVMNLARINLDLCEKLFEWPSFREFLKENATYDVILSEHFNSDCMFGVIHTFGLPSVGLMSSTMLPWTAARHGAPDNPAYVPGMTVSLTDSMTFSERLENTFFYYFYNWWFQLTIRSKEQALLERQLKTRLPPLAEVAGGASVVLMNTHHSLNGVKVLPPALVEVGGLHMHGRSVQPLSPELEKFVSEAEAGVILFSFGSLIRGSTLPPRRLRAFLQVFSQLRQRVLWKWEGENIEGLSSNVRVVKWLPQFDLLHHPNCVAFISHGGLLSMTEAVHAGVPMVVIPVLGDQFGNAAHARRAGFATVLPFRTIAEDTVQNALEEVLSPKLREGARRVSAEWLDRPAPPMHTAVYWVERVARRGSAELASHARRLAPHQLALLDVAGVLCCVLGALLLAAYYATRTALRLVRVTITPKQKLQ